MGIYGGNQIFLRLIVTEFIIVRIHIANEMYGYTCSACIFDLFRSAMRTSIHTLFVDMKDVSNLLRLR